MSFISLYANYKSVGKEFNAEVCWQGLANVTGGNDVTVF